jgi:hypothetical protein
MAEETRGQEQIENTQTTNQEVNQGNTQPEETGKDDMTMDGLLAQLATLKVENARNKAALDKQMKANGELTKQLRAKMSAAEQEAEEKKEAEEAQKKLISDLQDFKKRTEAKDRYMLMGMSAEFAKQAAEAEVKGDMDTLASVMKQYNDASLKAQQAEFLKNRPDINAGHGEGDDELTKLEKEAAAAMGVSD